MAQVLCDVTTAVADTPCLNCLSNDQLNQIEALLWIYVYNGPFEAGDISTLIEDCKCRPCLTQKQQLIAEITAMQRYFAVTDENATIDYFITRAKWLQGVKPNLVVASISCIQCTYIRTVLEYYQGTETCDIWDLAALNPCLNCLSETDLQKVLLALWVYALYGAYEWVDMIDRMQLCICRTCMKPKQIKVDLINSLYYYIETLYGTVTLDDFVDMAKCLHCFSSANVRAIASCAKCTFWNRSR